jgi:hypothetical protein
LIHFYALEGNAIDDWELFDLQKDPNELQSVYGLPEYSEPQAAMQRELKRLRDELRVPEDVNFGRGNRNSR